MIHEMKVARKYTLRKRAEQQEETRARITEAAMALHEEIGPARTTVSAIAERAGVERLTVYRHFADDREILQACSSLYARVHPAPDPSCWRMVEDPLDRARASLTAVYQWYRTTEPMFSRVVRDAEVVPGVREVWEGIQAGYFEPLRNDLMTAWKSRRRELRAALSHAFQFTTWQSLEREGLSDREKVALMLRWLAASAPKS